MDDLVIKTKAQASLIDDMEETFNNLRQTSMKLNSEKCVFGVPAGKLLGFLVSSRGIEANPDKIRAIEEMRPPSQLKDVPRLTGCMAVLGRFISRLGEKGLPLFKLLKKGAARLEGVCLLASSTHGSSPRGATTALCSSHSRGRERHPRD